MSSLEKLLRINHLSAKSEYLQKEIEHQRSMLDALEGRESTASPSGLGVVASINRHIGTLSLDLAATQHKLADELNSKEATSSDEDEAPSYILHLRLS